MKESVKDMQRSPGLLLLFAVAMLSVLGMADAGQWPRSVNVGGFTITDISGTLNNDGSGRGSGKLRLPGAGDVQVTLLRNSSGSIKASFSHRFSVSEVRVDGSFDLNAGGLRGLGTVKIEGQSISNASFSLSPQGVLNGSGRVQLGGISIPASFNISGSNSSISGSSPRQAAADTPLAHYTFKGELQLGFSRGSMSVNAVGVIERRGKVGNVANTFGPMSSTVNLQNGQASFNVAGVNVNFRLW